ncbi:MAG TPA: nuclear transport factor 2 family protein [Opitutaceae bacterium]|nr:nuclear transport factor 2 family protein [Opitutaceae bacterium]
MKTLPRLLLLSCLLLAPAFAADSLTDALKRADDARIAATLAADKAGLEAALSADLHYVHSSGRTDTKASYIEMLVGHTSVYDSYQYLERTFVPAGPGVALMYGRARIATHNSDHKTEHDLNFLAVWRQENGAWHFLAWQSCENPPATAAPATKR